ncbi:MAG TPA: tRNA (adenosine(37)-N6)-dimethylallyltransferase MiaA [Bacillota bacterium]|nr:tRNA (adenosine(37)-N6)-dimethylallyltransferase MiaA [Bacillota bacterium]
MKKVIVIVGPTAIGKTALSLDIAQMFNGEIISGDSMQVHVGMDIGTAKILPNEMKSIPHHLIDCIQPDEPYTVAQFQTDVRQCIEDIHERAHVPIIVGGSGLYIEAALYNYTFSEQKRDDTFTKNMEKVIKEKGIEPLFDRLKNVDPEHAAQIHPNNHRKVIRALEVYETTGKTMTESQEEDRQEPLYDILFIGLEMERPQLYERINHRVNFMIDKGLIDEVEGLLRQGFRAQKSMKAIGYKEIIEYLDGHVTKEEAIATLQRNSRRFAKRQYTWFKNRLPVHWYNVTNGLSSEVSEDINEDIAGFLKDT